MQNCGAQRIRHQSFGLRCLLILVLTVRFQHTFAATWQWGDTLAFSLRGFGTLGVVHSNQEQADFVSSIIFYQQL
ncbi:MAG: hypothetical protein R3E73_08335 [Porticoccaceae bacterium]|nr:hypothetical protein [Pseudomonadales bacterium]MCP5171350.1 hypothetical protein [Pseudomonadales bacterium]